jgi:hypothetical protein
MSRDRAGALMSTSRQASHRQQYSNEPRSGGASTELSDRSFRGPQATHARLPSLRLLSLSKHRGAGGEIVKRDLRGLAGAIGPAAQSVQDSPGQSPFTRRGWPRQSSFYGHMRHYRAASPCEEMTSAKGLKRHSRNCCRPGQVGTYGDKKFPTWRGHLPQKAFQGIRQIQVGIKTTRNFPTWQARQADRIDGECNFCIVFAANRAI